MKISEAFINALLADATYALGSKTEDGMTGTKLEDCNEGKLKERMTPALAKYIGDNFTVVTHIETDDIIGSGFDATVWKDNNSGKLYVSMQGTVGMADFLADISLATLNSAAGRQLVDMVNWWLCISTPKGEMAQQIKILAHSSGADFVFVNAPPVAGEGLITAEDLEKGIEVNGHSLGGYLASAFTRLFGTQANVSHTSTFNSAGFAPGSEEVFVNLQNLIGVGNGLGCFPNASEQTNYFAANGINVTTNSFWFNQVGQRDVVLCKPIVKGGKMVNTRFHTWITASS